MSFASLSVGTATVPPRKIWWLAISGGGPGAASNDITYRPGGGGGGAGGPSGSPLGLRGSTTGIVAGTAITVTVGGASGQSGVAGTLNGYVGIGASGATGGYGANYTYSGGNFVFDAFSDGINAGGGGSATQNGSSSTTAGGNGGAGAYDAALKSNTGLVDFDSLYIIVGDGGGGGGGYNFTNGGTSPYGYGGKGGYNSSTGLSGQNGVAYSGSGGGGGGMANFDVRPGGAGGSGSVWIIYPASYSPIVGGTATYTDYTADYPSTYRIYRIQSTGTIIF